SIRYFHVTGVQTCALPISAYRGGGIHPARALGRNPDQLGRSAIGPDIQAGLARWKDVGIRSGVPLDLEPALRQRRHIACFGARQIGRASCRASVKLSYVY